MMMMILIEITIDHELLLKYDYTSLPHTLKWRNVKSAISAEHCGRIPHAFRCMTILYFDRIRYTLDGCQYSDET